MAAGRSWGTELKTKNSEYKGPEVGGGMEMPLLSIPCPQLCREAAIGRAGFQEPLWASPGVRL